MKTQFLYHMREHPGCTTSDKILLAISGGIDSMVMLHLFLTSGFSVGVAHCNFQLRGADADEDAAFVVRHCESVGVPCTAKRFDTAGYAGQHGLSTQMAARELRYAWFESLMEKDGYNFLATAHNLNDNIETVLLNLTRSTGFDGMKGIPPRNGRTIRPLLHFSREQLEAYAKTNGVVWREDASNASDDYQRNFIRHHVVPLLREVNPNLEEGFDKTVTRFRAASELMEIGRQQFFRDYTIREGEDLRIAKAFAIKFENPPGVLWEMVRTYGFNFAQCEDILRALDGHSGKRFHAGEFDLIIDREALILTPHHTSIGLVLIYPDTQDLLRDTQTLAISRTSSLHPSESNFIACLDEDKLAFPLTWRSWIAGDSFSPLGMKGRKKISDFLIDQKVSLSDKEKVTVIESNGDIIWVVGHRIDDRFKITPQTTKVLKLSVSSLFV